VKKAQSAVEYLMIIVITLGVIVPAAYLFFRFGSESNTEIIESQINQLGRSMKDTAETVYYSGEGAKIVLDVNLPESVTDIFILHERELVFNVSTAIGSGDRVFFSAVNITSQSCLAEVCSLSEIANPGLIKVKFLSNGNEVLISKP
jgi:hypothetical protein